MIEIRHEGVVISMMNNVVNILSEYIVFRVVYVLRYIFRNVFHAAFRIYNE